MKSFYLASSIAAFALLSSCSSGGEETVDGTTADTTAAIAPQELESWRIPNLGSGGEYYFSPDGKTIIGNLTTGMIDSTKIHSVTTINIDGTDLRKINSIGDDACSYFFPDGNRIVYTSTKDNPDMSLGNWSKATDYPQGAELYTCDLNGGDVKRLTNNKYYDAEVSVSPDGEWILFTRQIDGKLDLWKMRSDGTDEFQITNTPDWQEGGSFYMPDGKTILFRAWATEDDEKSGKTMVISTIKDDGTELTQITTEDVMNWCPHPAPDGDHFVFVKLLPPHNYEVFLMSISTGEQQQLTFNDAFDAFPVISEDGQTMTFSSSREAAKGEHALYQHFMDISSLNLGPKE